MSFKAVTRLEVRLEHGPGDDEVVGRLAIERRQSFFEYDPAFIAAGRSISPLRLPLRAGLQAGPEGHLRGLHGVFDDSLPDGWGLLLMDRTFQARGLRTAELSPLDRLAYLGRRTLGALTYHPCSESDAPSYEALDLATLATASREIFEGRTTEVLPALRRAGGSPGGARPKVLIGVRDDRIISGADRLPPDFHPWLLKFATSSELPNTGPLEYAYARMARAAGITMPEVRLFGPLPDGERCFAVRLFDRDGNVRSHVHTLANLMHADYRTPNLDYEHLLRVALKLTGSHAQVRECFRRAVFNLLSHNRDDHGKNFAFIMARDGHWTASPAYDLTFVEGPGGEHTMTFRGEGRRPTWAHLQQLADLVSLDAAEALEILEQVREGVGSFASEATRLQLPAAQIRELAERLARTADAAALPAPRRPKPRASPARKTSPRKRAS